ncbi:family 3 extracellular solute-binding protein [Bacillus methanolicus PB1]|uniref:Family 3 extracellular solute-binding protein n=1 Tax=Bacillus methanolicus PB1 TaxID=997296 RepID=I3E6X8_BACMT|nr:ABC transporter substrate-binding protein [Bacillus methanolicus]EIJ82249.1 family 3 extracellular solute-binding protein [Bacillus methanolicus PB1]
MEMTSNHKKKRVLKGLTGILFLTFFLIGIIGCSNDSQTTAAQSSAQKGSSDSSVLRIGYVGSSKDNIPTGVEGWAIQKKLLQQELKKKGIEKFEFHAFPNGPPLNEAIAAGELDIGILGDTPAIVGKSNGLKTKLISQTSINSNVWLITPKNGVKSVEELKGKTVATQLGSYMYRYLIGLLKEKGLDKDVKIVNMLASDAEAALERKDIAAYAFPTNSGPLIKSKGFPVIDEAKDHPELLGSSVVVITDDYLSKYPDLPKIWNDVRKQALEDLLKNPEGFYQFQSEQVGYPVEVMKDSLPLDNLKLDPLSEEGIKLLEGTKKFLVEEEFAKKDFNLKDWIAK